MYWFQGYKKYIMRNSAEPEIWMFISIKNIKKLINFEARLSLYTFSHSLQIQILVNFSEWNCLFS